MSVSITIKQQLISKIQSCPSVQTVYGYEEINPSGFPAVFITAGDLEGEFSSTAENSRIYGYNCLIIFPIGQDFIPPNQMDRLQYAEETVATVVDEIINAIDTDFELDGSPVLYTNAVDNTWSYVSYEGGEARGSTLTIRVYTEKVVV